jgi:hypothetical protein
MMSFIKNVQLTIDKTQTSIDKDRGACRMHATATSDLLQRFANLQMHPSLLLLSPLRVTICAWQDSNRQHTAAAPSESDLCLSPAFLPILLAKQIS